jgi:hypothetical protein
MNEEATMGQVIENSGGTLEMEVLEELDGNAFPVTAPMRQVIVSLFSKR